MTAKHGPSDEDLLQLIAQKEKELETTLAQTRQEASRLVEDARRRAEHIREEARRAAESLEARTRDELAREADAISNERLMRAQAEVAQIRSRAAERVPQAVKLVVERVLGDLVEKT